ncbi:hypothetical protein AX774_g5505 [Zancudomyces culisetae]|uniref:Uncharacterized protein n=1 Tax=Zancudomyces culisetae TaxID=1213189 RepID=A0A1R1PJE8_ZANCU|nr:hypothetical protein AX774_g5505 [Zancudomyces culisetae]|eukprot:OMH81039.1 hypothetical protein AX774_g5505 [Zancudomyces culisetae]
MISPNSLPTVPDLLSDLLNPWPVVPDQLSILHPQSLAGIPLNTLVPILRPSYHSHLCPPQDTINHPGLFVHFAGQVFALLVPPLVR